MAIGVGLWLTAKPASPPVEPVGSGLAVEGPFPRLRYKMPARVWAAERCGRQGRGRRPMHASERRDSARHQREAGQGTTGDREALLPDGVGKALRALLRLIFNRCSCVAVYAALWLAGLSFHENHGNCGRTESMVLRNRVGHVPVKQLREESTVVFHQDHPTDLLGLVRSVESVNQDRRATSLHAWGEHGWGR